MNLKATILGLLSLSFFAVCQFIFSCSLTDSATFRDISYFSPKFIPSSNKIVILKNIRSYSQTGTPGGVKDDELSTSWFLLEYDIANGAYTTTALREITFTPFWMRLGITSVTDSFVTIIGNDQLFLVNLNTHAQKSYQTDIFLVNASIDIQSNSIIQVKSVDSTYALISQNINSGTISELLHLDNYYANISIPPVLNHRYYFLSYTSITLVNTSNWSLKVLPNIARYVSAYDSNKVAILESSNSISFFTVNTDTLVKDAAVTLAHSGLVNISVNKSMNYLVFQIGSATNDGSIILRNLVTNEETILFANMHESE